MKIFKSLCKLILQNHKKSPFRTKTNLEETKEEMNLEVFMNALPKFRLFNCESSKKLFNAFITGSNETCFEKPDFYLPETESVN